MPGQRDADRPILRTPLCDLLGVEYPVCLAGMGSRGRATPPALVAAVSNAGGLGVAGGANLTPGEIRSRIREIKALTDKPFAVNLLFPASLSQAENSRSQIRDLLQRDYPQHVAFVKDLMRELSLEDAPVEQESVLATGDIHEQLEVVLEERVPILSAGLGDPSWAVPMAREQGMKVIGLAGSVRNAMRQVEAGVDAVVAQGYEAGGHTGRIATLPLVPQVVDAVAPTPVLAAGGIGDGRGLAAALSLGAVGAWVGTAFLTSVESEVWDVQKEEILGARSEDFPVTRAYTGKTARDYKNIVIDAWESSGLEPLPMPLQQVLMEDFSSAAMNSGRYDLVNSPAGQIGGMATELKPAERILREMVEGAISAIVEQQGFVFSSSASG